MIFYFSIVNSPVSEVLLTFFNNWSHQFPVTTGEKGKTTAQHRELQNHHGQWQIQEKGRQAPFWGRPPMRENMSKRTNWVRLGAGDIRNDNLLRYVYAA